MDLNGTCVDIDECDLANPTHNCLIDSLNETCHNTVGSFYCEKLPCETECPVCGSNAQCVISTDKGASCECFPGYEGNPDQGCTDIDECMTEICDENITEKVTCFNSDAGNVSLSCPIGTKIGVLDGNFGRSDTETCCSPNDQNNGECDACGVVSALAQVAAQCNGKESCVAHLQRGDFALPPSCSKQKLVANVTFVCFETACETGERCLNANGSFICECPVGFIRNPETTLCDDVDECDDATLNICHNQTHCVNTVGGYHCGNDTCPTCPTCGEHASCVINNTDATPICKCMSGYEGDPYDACSDIDECKNCTLHACHSKLPCQEYSESFCSTRTAGLREITCPSNKIIYVSSAMAGRKDSETCCSASDFQSGWCASCGMTDVLGLFQMNCNEKETCSANVSSALIETPTCDGLSIYTDISWRCLDKDDEVCVNTRGSYFCKCPSGHVWNPLTDTCSDIDECADASRNNCKSNATCANTVGSYICYETDCPSCPLCGVNAHCHFQNASSPVCECDNGFEGDAYIECVDVDECAFDSCQHSYSEKITCLNNRSGNVDITCPNNTLIAVLDANLGRRDADQCCTEEDGNKGLCGTCHMTSTLQLTSDECNAKSECSLSYNDTFFNIPASCDGKRLVANVTWVCLDLPCEANEICHNANGTFSCLCPSGYERNGSCVDIDECERHLHNCDSTDTCQNTIGSYYCETESCKEKCGECGKNARCDVDEMRCVCEDGYQGQGLKALVRII